MSESEEVRCLNEYSRLWKSINVQIKDEVKQSMRVPKYLTAFLLAILAAGGAYAASAVSDIREALSTSAEISKTRDEAIADGEDIARLKAQAATSATVAEGALQVSDTLLRSLEAALDDARDAVAKARSAEKDARALVSSQVSGVGHFLLTESDLQSNVIAEIKKSLPFSVNAETGAVHFASAVSMGSSLHLQDGTALTGRPLVHVGYASMQGRGVTPPSNAWVPIATGKLGGTGPGTVLAFAAVEADVPVGRDVTRPDAASVREIRLQLSLENGIKSEQTHVKMIPKEPLKGHAFDLTTTGLVQLVGRVEQGDSRGVTLSARSGVSGGGPIQAGGVSIWFVPDPE